MNTKKLTLTRWSLVVLTCLGVLLVAGFIRVSTGETVQSQLARVPLDLDVPVMQQSLTTSCGEAVIAMIHNYAYPATPITEAEVIEYATVNGYYTPGVSPFTSPANMVKIAEYYADGISSGTVTSPGQGLLILFQNLRNGDPVVIDVLSNFNDPESEAHFIIVTGLSIDNARDNTIIVHYNDPLTGTKETANWLGEGGVWNAWLTNGDPGGAGWWLVMETP